MHNVRVEQINEVAKQSKSDASLAQLDFNFEGSWNQEKIASSENVNTNCETCDKLSHFY